MSEHDESKSRQQWEANQSPATERGRERTDEDQRYVPVIVKRTDEARRHPDDILQKAIEEGLEQLDRPPFSLFLSAVGAGLILTFTAMAVGVTSTLVGDAGSEALQRMALALVYPFGFVVCLMSGTELFTEHSVLSSEILDGRLLAASEPP